MALKASLLCLGPSCLSAQRPAILIQLGNPGLGGQAQSDEDSIQDNLVRAASITALGLRRGPEVKGPDQQSRLLLLVQVDGICLFLPLSFCVCLVHAVRIQLKQHLVS